jgi:hypothetical protein
MAPGLTGAKFEQGGFTSGRRKGPKTLFPSKTRELVLAETSRRKTRRDVSSRARNMANSADDYHWEFVLARLQKAQSSENAAINLSGYRNSSV